MKEKLDKVRHQIDLIDYKIISLLEDRINLVQQVAHIKSANFALSYIKSNREADMLKKLIKQSDKIPDQIIINMWRLIISSSLQFEKEFSANYYGKFNEKAKRLIREYFSSLTKINFVEDLHDNFKEQDLLIFSDDEFSIYHFLLLQQKYKIFAKLPDIDEKQQYFKLSNLLVAAKVNQDTIALDRAIIASHKLIDNENALFVAEIKFNTKIYYIYNLNKELYQKIGFLGKSGDKIIFLGGYIDKLQ